MPITFYRYGRDSHDDRVPSIPEQARETLKVYQRMLARGALPPDTIDGGFFGDGNVNQKATKFRCRTMGWEVVARCQRGDRICVATYDRLVYFPTDTFETLQWAKEAGVGLVFPDLGVDTATPDGQLWVERMLKTVGYELLERSIRSRRMHKRSEKTGMVHGSPPIGYQLVRIKPVKGGRVIRWYLPSPAERQYAQRIVMMRDEMGMSYPQIALRFSRENIVNPRSGLAPGCITGVQRYYRACKAGWPMPGGKKWMPPPFKYLRMGKIDEVDLEKECA